MSRKLSPLEGNYHCCLGLEIVSIFNKEDIDPEDELPDGEAEPLLSMTPADALALAKYILANERSLQIGDKALKKKFEEESQLILKQLPDRWKQDRAAEEKKDRPAKPDYWRLKGLLLFIRDDLYIRGEIFGRGKQFEELFWNYFDRKYDEQLRKEYLPAQEED